MSTVCKALILLLAVESQAAELPALPNLASRYGFLRVEHCHVVELSHQIDRALYYNPERENQENFKSLDAAIGRSERSLDEARTEYARLYSTNKSDPPVLLIKLLDEAGTQDSMNRQAAEKLLQAIGQRLAPGKFRSLVVSDAELKPRLENATDKSFKPTRILFGSTATPGEARVAPLQFDFCKGVFGFYAPMSAPGKLEKEEALRAGTDAEHTWMRSAQVRYHYWAGVYNNQNTYVAPWFLKVHGSEDDVWMKLADGKLLKGTGEWGQLNIWNSNVQEYIRDYSAAQARTLKDDPLLLCYDYTAEPHPWGGQGPEPAGLAQYSGYNESARFSFREYLRQKFGSIGNLNKAWSTTYSDFSAIEPPPDPYMQLPPRATPLSYEFERFRCDSHTRVWKIAYDAYRKLDRSKPVVANASMYMSGWPLEALDAWQMQKAPVADWIDMHMNNFPPNLPEQIYLYSLCRLTGRVPVQFEYIWTFPRSQPFDDSNESDFQATCEASVWRNLAWGKQAFVFFDVAYDWPAYHNAFLDRDLGYSILRPSICVVPALKRKVLRFNDLLLNTEVVSPPTIILQPSTSILNSPPVHPNRGFSFHTSVASEVHKLLFPRNYSFLYVPEEAILEDGYSLKRNKVIVLPQAPYLPDKMVARLLSWIKDGGTLISLGVPGVWNPYGQEDGRLLTRVFGRNTVVDEKPGHWRWNWTLQEALGGVEVLTNASGKLIAAQAHYGKGTVLVSTGSFSSAELRAPFYTALDHGIGTRSAYCAKDSFELVLREDNRKRRYLFALNPHTRETREDDVILTGKFAQCTDLGIGSGVPVPAKITGPQTRLTLRLHPGEGTIIALAE